MSIACLVTCSARTKCTRAIGKTPWQEAEAFQRETKEVAPAGHLPVSAFSPSIVGSGWGEYPNEGSPGSEGGIGKPRQFSTFPSAMLTSTDPTSYDAMSMRARASCRASRWPTGSDEDHAP